MKMISTVFDENVNERWERGKDWRREKDGRLRRGTRKVRKKSWTACSSPVRTRLKVWRKNRIIAKRILLGSGTSLGKDKLALIKDTGRFLQKLFPAFFQECEGLGKGTGKKGVYFWALADRGGGRPPPNFLALFHHLLFGQKMQMFWTLNCFNIVREAPFHLFWAF